MSVCTPLWRELCSVLALFGGGVCWGIALTLWTVPLPTPSKERNDGR